MSDTRTPAEYALDHLTDAELSIQLLQQRLAETREEIERLVDTAPLLRSEIERLKAELAKLKACTP